MGTRFFISIPLLLMYAHCQITNESFYFDLITSWPGLHVTHSQLLEVALSSQNATTVHQRIPYCAITAHGGRLIRSTNARDNTAHESIHAEKAL